MQLLVTIYDFIFVVKNEKLGLQYRNRIAKFVNKMSHTPKPIQNYKSNPLARDANADESKLTTFAFDPT